MLFSFDQPSETQRQEIPYNSTEKQVYPSFTGEIYSSKIKNLFKREHDDILFQIMVNDNEISTSDIIPREYEGGLKTWECSLDLVDFITSELVYDKVVIELGCGSALPGINALVHGARQVDFQDFNEM
jgi:hypothetical protein